MSLSVAGLERICAAALDRAESLPAEQMHDVAILVAVVREYIGLCGVLRAAVPRALPTDTAEGLLAMLVRDRDRAEEIADGRMRVIEELRADAEAKAGHHDRMCSAASAAIEQAERERDEALAEMARKR